MTLFLGIPLAGMVGFEPTGVRSCSATDPDGFKDRCNKPLCHIPTTDTRPLETGAGFEPAWSVFARAVPNHSATPSTTVAAQMT